MYIRVNMADGLCEFHFSIFEDMINPENMIEIGDTLFFTIKGTHQQISVYKPLYYRLKREHLIDKIIE